ncbi:MAG: asparagine synthase (glutamine-hydrolyzing) [Candidatus Paceibacterota bacterium]
MCGIIGSTNIDEKIIKESLSKITHRGPDGSGLYKDGNLIFGHNRLAIIDLSNLSAQPMTSDDGLITIIFNGEIYNYQELRDGLKKTGQNFRSNGDTEVILNGYKKEGINFFKKLRGMWAFAIYDKNRQQIILSRDYFGIKPLLFSTKNRELVFASEAKALVDMVDMEINKDYYCQFFNFGFVAAPQTCFKEIQKVEPGAVMIWDIKAKSFIEEQNIFDNLEIKSEKINNNNTEDVVEKLNKILLDSVNKHFVSDVPVGILFSGGNDSSLLAALAAGLGKKPTLYHLSIKGSSDTYYAEKIAKHLNLPLEIFELDEQRLNDQYEKIWKILDEPTADVSVIPTSLIYSLVSKKAKVVLSGEGGDELFGGYHRHRRLARLNKIKKNNRVVVFFNTLGSLSNSFFLKYFNPAIGRLRNMFLDKFQNDIIGSYVKEIKIVDFPLYYKELRSFLFNFYQKNINRCFPGNLLFDLFYYLPNSLMYKNDISSMASSVEARTPFLDKEVFSWVFSNIPGDILLSEQNKDKALLKKVMEKYLPKDLIYRDKKGFGISFNLYNSDYFKEDLKKALSFHCQNADKFLPNRLSSIKKIFDIKNTDIIIKKYSRFAFAIISNWKIFNRETK